jgi:protocatechuate 3,4-dioxygenase beta subunit
VNDFRRLFSRTELIGLLGVAGGAWAGCSGGGGTAASSLPSASAVAAATAGAAATSTAAAAGACAATLEGEIGPYFVDDGATGFARSDVRTNLDGSATQIGIPLTLTLRVYDTQSACAPVSGSQVDIWHCNAAGSYSDEAALNTAGITWLRGYQITDATGTVTFKTIVPGWYQGRTTHIHLRVRSKYSQASSPSDGSNTTQVFFAQTLIDSINATVAPYSAHGTNPTTNASDQVYAQETQGRNELALVGDMTSGYTATFSIGLPI